MTNPTSLVSMFESDLSATDRVGPTVWANPVGTPTFSDTQMHLDDGDAVLITPLEHLDSRSGSVSFQFTRESDTGDVEYLLECGSDGADWLRVYVDGSDDLVLWWSSDGAAATTLAGPITMSTDTRYFVSCSWQHTATAIVCGVVSSEGVVNSVQTTTGTRDAPVGSWGTEQMVLVAAGPGSAYGEGDYGDDEYGA